MAGILYLVATPIGNLEDITRRAERVLGEVSLIACEDTRHSRRLLDHLGIRTPTVSYHEHNETQRTPELLARLSAGQRIALIADAGTPLVSDPGYRLVAAAAASGIRVEPIPGASALLAALTASGLPTDCFHFAGFLPAKPPQRRKALEALKPVTATLVFYEAPHRVTASLADIGEVLGPRPMAAAREITKLHEEFLRGTPAEILGELASRPSVKGEFTLVVAGARAPEPGGAPPAAEVAELVGAGMPRMDAIKTVARRRGLPKREVYKLLEDGR
jgi:16S rRNA (cytidine1402-2'-O)-methyltransferase